MQIPFYYCPTHFNFVYFLHLMLSLLIALICLFGDGRLRCELIDPRRGRRNCLFHGILIDDPLLGLLAPLGEKFGP